MAKSKIILHCMTQDEKWKIKYDEVVSFIETNHRNPSKHRIEEHGMLNWVKQQRKLSKVTPARGQVPGRYIASLPLVMSSVVETSLHVLRLA